MFAHTRLVLLSTVAILTACATAQENPQYQYSTQYKGDSPSTAYASNNAGEALHYASTRSANGAATVQNAGYTVAPAQETYTQTPYTQAPYTQPASYEVTVYSAPQAASSGASYTQVNADCVSNGAQGTAACVPSPRPIIEQSAYVATPYYAPDNAVELQTASNVTTYESTSYSASSAVSPTDSTMPDSYGTPGYEAMKNVEGGWDYETITPLSVSGPAAQSAQAFEKVAPAPAPTASVHTARTADMMPAPEQNIALGTQHQVRQGDTVYSYARTLCTTIDDIRAANNLERTLVFVWATLFACPRPNANLVLTPYTINFSAA